MKLWYFNLLEDDEQVKYAAEVWDELENKKIEEKYILLHVVGIFLELSKLGLIDHDADSIINRAEANLNQLAVDGKLLMAKHDKLNTSASYSLTYQSKSDSAFRAFVSKFVNAVEKANDWPIKAKELLDALKTNDSLFIVRITLTNSPENLYYNVRS